MDVRTVAAAVLAASLASCSGGIYDASDFMRRKPADAATAEAAASQTVSAEAAADGATPVAADAAAANTPDPAPLAEAVEVADTAAQSAETLTAESQSAESRSADATVTAPATGTDPATVTAPATGGLLAMFGVTRNLPVVASEPAADAATELAAVAPSAPFAPEPDIEEISEAELAGEVEADPDEIAPPKMPDDGLAHDFVNVYTSRPDKPVEMIEGLPGVNWQGGLVLVSRTPDDDSLFGGIDHPFARTVPGVPRKIVQAANGLLLAHSAINVSCVKPKLLNLVRRAESHFGKKVVITSGYRSPAHNRRVRGALHSQHMFCAALDLYMPGVARDDLARFFFAQPDRGGIGLYCHTRSIHVDIGKKRQWRWPCRRKLG